MKKLVESLTDLSDMQLAIAVQRGNNKAFDVLMLRHASHLKKYLHRLLHNNEIEQDVLQDIWLRVLSLLRGYIYRENGQFSGWLNSIAFKKAMQVKEQEKHYVHNSIPEQQEEPACYKELFAENILAEKVKPLLEKMKEPVQKIVYLRLEKKMRFRKIAARLHTTTNIVTALFSRAMIRLRKQLKKKNKF